MKEENAKAQMRKGMLEFCILLMLRLHEAYTGDILKTLQEHGLLVVEGTLYPLLSRLKKEGILTYRWEESTQGPPRKYFTLTNYGRIRLEDLTSAWNELETVVNNLKNRLPS